MLQVAELAIQGVERGLFFGPQPDMFSSIAVASMAGASPRVFNELIELLLLPLYLLLHVILRRRTDAKILKWRLESAASPSGVPFSRCWACWCRGAGV